LTPTAASALRIVTFGDLDTGIWGATWASSDAALALRAGGSALTAPATIETGDEGEDWTLRADGVELTVSPEAEPVSSEVLGGFDQLGRLSGHATLSDGNTVTIEALCRRGIRDALRPGAADSIRDVSCWFEPDRGLALTAVRPRKTKGHDRDLIAAAVLDVEGAHPIAEPRLSTTYTEDGRPARAGLELWRAEDENGEQSYPTRAAGEVAGPGLVTAAEGMEVQAEPFRWHSRGAEGTGVYLLVRPR